MKILIVGAGSIGARHADNARALKLDTKVFDTDSDKSDFKTIGDALVWGPQAAVIATPHHTHIDLAAQAVRAGADVLIEKPVSHKAEGVAEFLQAAKEAGRQVFVACNTRFHPAVRALKNNLSRIGAVYFARAHFGNYLPNMRPGADYRALYCAQKDQGGGVILDVIHEIDYLTWILGDAVSVTCEAARRSDLDINVEDYAAMTMEHAGGVRSEIHMDYLQQCRRRGCEIVGSKGTLVWQSEGKNPERCTVRVFENGAWESLYESAAVDVAGPYKAMLKQFITCVEKPGAAQDLLEGPQAFEGLKVALAAHMSAEQGRKIHVRKFRAVA